MRKSTTDLHFAGYLKYLGKQVVDFKIVYTDAKGRPLKASFYFDLTDEEWKQLKLDFNVSEVSKVKQEVEALKDMLY